MNSSSFCIRVAPSDSDTDSNAEGGESTASFAIRTPQNDADDSSDDESEAQSKFRPLGSSTSPASAWRSASAVPASPAAQSPSTAGARPLPSPETSKQAVHKAWMTTESGHGLSSGAQSSERLQNQASEPGQTSSSGGQALLSSPASEKRLQRLRQRQQLEAASLLAQQAALQVSLQLQQCDLDNALANIDADKQLQLARIAHETQAAKERAARDDAHIRHAREGERDRLLSQLQEKHQEEAHTADAHIRAAEQQEQQKAAERHRQLATAEAERQQEAAAAAAAQQAEAKYLQEQQEAEAAAKQAASAAAATQQAAHSAKEQGQDQATSLSIATPEALSHEEHVQQQWVNAEAQVQGFVGDASLKKARRDIDKTITLNVQQISGTRQQVAKKAKDLQQYLGSLPPEQCVYAMMQLMRRFMSQCEVQVSLKREFAFPLGEVAAAVLAAHPAAADLLIAKMHQGSPVAVPRWQARKAGQEAEWQDAMRFQEREAAGVGAAKRPETDDEYLARLQGCLAFYAAVLQSSTPGNPLGPGQAWHFLSRLLNGLPANRLTAAALDTFLQIAGFCLFKTFRQQFMKLLFYVDQHFLPDLAKVNDPDIRPVHSRLHTFMSTRRYEREPDGWRLPNSDTSSYDRA
ncbi:hypothetical protein WJX74_004283 [Apatococcus lobatus]|uniref:mRNA export factor GLE1 n=1 Tax=Apatococcus lobatus TaxID=904363 RepID=A0AAW1REF9_9CHLO